MFVDERSDPICIIAAIGKQVGSFGQVLQQLCRHRRIMGLAGGEFELKGKTMSIHPQMQLGGQSAPAATDMIISTLFFWAAAC